jgi:hypothetical protein
MEIGRFNGIVPAVHLFAFMPNDFHSGRGINACSSKICAGGMPEVMKREASFCSSGPNASSATCCGECRPRILPWFSLIQEDPIGVQTTFLP